jgi:hypothetical protein
VAKCINCGHQEKEHAVRDGKAGDDTLRIQTCARRGCVCVRAENVTWQGEQSGRTKTAAHESQEAPR